MRTIHTDTAPAALGPYSQAKATCKLIFTSGQIAIDPAEGKIVDTLSKIKGMEASIQTYEASGAALKSGIYLNNLFLGTGYNDNIRIPLDYGSDMYEVKEIQ